MTGPRIAVGAVLALGSALGARALWRMNARRRLRVDLYFEDGAMISLTATNPEAEAVVVRAREALEAARA